MVQARFYHDLPMEAKIIRQEVFVEEQGFQEEFEDDESIYIHLVLFLDDKPISTARIKKLDPERYQLQRMAVLKPFRGLKIGTYTLKFCQTKIKTLGGREIVLEAQLDKSGFYAKNGFKPIDGEIVYDQDYPHIWMRKVIIRPKNK